MDGLMMDYQLNVPAILRRADELYGDNEIASRLPDKSWHTYTYADFVSRTKKLIVALRSSASRTATASGRSCGTTRSTSRRTWARRSAGSSPTR